MQECRFTTLKNQRFSRTGRVKKNHNILRKTQYLMNTLYINDYQLGRHRMKSSDILVKTLTILICYFCLVYLFCFACCLVPIITFRLGIFRGIIQYLLFLLYVIVSVYELVLLYDHLGKLLIISQELSDEEDGSENGLGSEDSIGSKIHCHCCYEQVPTYST